MTPLWKWELVRWRNRLERERGGPVRLRIQAIKEIDRAIAYLSEMHRAGLVLQDADLSVWKN